MRRYILVSNYNSSISIESLGVHLAGRGSQAVVDAESADRSSELLTHIQAHRVTKNVVLETVRRNNDVVKRVMLENDMKPIWPFVPSEPETPVEAKTRDDELMTSMDNMSKRLDHLISAMVSQSRPVPPSPLPFVSQRNTPVDNRIAEDPNEPIFIPSKIVPETTNLDIRTHSGESKREDLDDVSSKLKALRGKKS